MQKPTALLNSKIIDFVLSDANLHNLLQRRDNHNLTFGIELTCKFIKKYDTVPGKSIYSVDFIYDVKDPSLEFKDDVSVIVEVLAGNPPTFKILNLRVY